MSAASDLIERAEKQAGCRFDESEGQNMAMALIMGAMAREMGMTPNSYREDDDMAVGLLLMHSNERKKRDEGLAMLLAMGLSPDDILSMTKR